MKVHIPSDTLSRPAVVPLTPGNASDVATAPAVLVAAPGRIRRLLADKGGVCLWAGQRPDPGDADWLRADLRKAGIVPMIPDTRGRKCPICYNRPRYKDRWPIEAVLGILKDFRRVATRCNKLAQNYASAVALAAAIAFWC